VVDDDEGMRRLAAVIFAHDGHHVDEARDGADGLARARADVYDLVLTDRRAAAAGEPFATALARARPEWGPRIVITGASPGDGAGAGALILPKPFTPRDLRAVAAEVWNTSA